VTEPESTGPLRYKGYCGRYEVDPDEGVLHGRVNGIRDVVTFVADNTEDLEREFRISVECYLDFCAERGVEPNLPAPSRSVPPPDPLRPPETA
jgi:predicted HicB family RNase H-like nuclease